ncbi:MAG: hypothetical protein QJR03_03885 [Sphaerobacter sp.]|nr:hypothetical protein [Sphaerobacter sp.]
MASSHGTTTHNWHRPLPKVWDLPPQRIVADGLRRIREGGATYRLLLILCAILGVVGVVALIAGPVLAGWGERQPWTYVAVTFGFLMSTIGSAPCLSVATRLVRSHWRRPVNRLAEIWAAGMIVPLILFFLLVALLPNTEGRYSVWFGWWGAPWLWDSLLMVALVVCGYAFLYTAAMPDMAVARDQAGPNHNGRFARLARGFRGSVQEWRTIDRGVAYLGVLYVLLYVGTMTIIASDFILSLIPGNNSAIFPATYTVQAFESGIALTLVTAGIMRWRGGAADYLDREQFFALGKLQLALGLLWFYFHWTEFIIWWYGRTPRETALLKLLYFGPYFVPFAIAFALMFLAPLSILLWTRIRMGIAGPIVAGALVLVGQVFEQIRLYSASFSNVDLRLRELDFIPTAYVPGVWDILLLVGLVGGAIGLGLVTLKVVPYPSIWEVTGGLWLRARKPFYKTEVVVIGKPE